MDRQGPAAQSGACQNGNEENGEAGGILGKITAGIHAVSETINDIVRPKLKNTKIESLWIRKTFLDFSKLY